jgi:hypothetical protein
VAQITREFDEPYFGNGEGGTSPLSNFSPSVVGIAGVPYLLDTESGNYRRESFDVVQQRNNASQRDVLLLPQDVWRQQTESWHLGSGQSNLDRDNSLTYRYQESFGIDPFANQWQFNLLKKTTLLAGTDAFAGELWLTTNEDYLAAVNGAGVYWWAGLGSASVGSTAAPAGFTIADIANDGYIVTVMAYDATRTHVYYIEGPAGSWTQWGSANYSLDASFIAWEKDYLLVGDGNVLKQAPKSGGANTVYTHPDSSFRWYSACAGDSCIYVLGRLGDRTVIHRVNIKQDGSGLQPCIQAAVLPDGEVGYTVESYLGFILIGTSKGVRVATSTNDVGDLLLGPVIPTSQPVRCFEGQDRFVWYGNNVMDSAYSVTGATAPTVPVFPTTCAGLGRLDLSAATTSPQTPAYIQDIAATSIASGVVRSVRTFDGKRVFSIDDEGVWFESDEYMDAGWLKEGTMSFGVEDLKTGLYVQGKWLPLTGKIALDVAYDSGSWQRVGVMQIQGSIRSSNLSLGGNQFSRMNSRTLLIRDPDLPETTPVFTRWEMRAIPAKGRASRWTLPVMNYEEIEIDGVKYTRDCLTVLNTLLGYGYNGKIFALQESGQSYQVHVKDYVWQPEKLTINGKAWQGTLTLVVEEVA